MTTFGRDQDASFVGDSCHGSGGKGIALPIEHCVSPGQFLVTERTMFSFPGTNCSQALLKHQSASSGSVEPSRKTHLMAINGMGCSRRHLFLKPNG